MIAKSIRHKQHAGLKIGSDPSGDYRLPLSGGQFDRTSGVNAHRVGILLAHFDITTGKELSF
jgi:hypothetical protein